MGIQLEVRSSAPGGLRRPGRFYIRGFAYLVLIISVQFAVVGVVYLKTGEQVLFSGLNSDDVAEVSAFLKDKGVAYRISDAGTSVLVRGGVESLQKDFEASEWQQARAHRDQEENGLKPSQVVANPDPRRLDTIRKELEKLLAHGSERIAWARVGFPHEEKAALEDGEGRKGAAVFVGTGGQVLPPVDVERIQWVVANSFAGLKPADVTVLDEVGRELTRAVRD